MNIQDFHIRLLSRQENRMRRDLTVTSAMLDKLERPDRAYQTIIVGGTNGKGSTVSYLSNIFHQAESNVGALYSPHIESVCERIQLYGENIEEDVLVQYSADFENALGESLAGELSYYEYLVGLGAYIFREEAVDYVIAEVGLGGRWDAVNAFDRVAVGLTTIDFDHMKILGNTLAKIATEKAQLIQRDIPTFSVKQTMEVTKVLDAEARKREGVIRWVESQNHIELSLRGRHQLQNASLAMSLAEHFGISKEIAIQALRTAKLPGRLERWNRNDHHTLWLDVAHNTGSARSVVGYFQDQGIRIDRILLGMLEDKDWKSVIRIFSEITSDFTLCTPPHIERAWDLHRVASELPSSLNLAIAGTPEEGLLKIMNSDGTTLCSGSFYTVGAVRPRLRALGWSPG